MSRIGKQPIAIPPKVKVEVKGQQVSVEGPKGKLNWELPRRTSLKVQNDKVVVDRQGNDAQARALHGLSRALVNNMVKGVSEGIVKKSVIQTNELHQRTAPDFMYFALRRALYLSPVARHSTLVR